VTELDPAEACERFPALAEPRRAVHYADAARVDGRLFTAALRRASAESVRVEDGERRRSRLRRPVGRRIVRGRGHPRAGRWLCPHPTAGGVHEVLDRALGAVPGLADATFEEVRVGLRPATPDGLPVIGGVPGVEGAYLATAHGQTGLQLGPYTGKVVAELVGDGSPEVDLDPFGVERFDSVRSPDR